MSLDLVERARRGDHGFDPDATWLLDPTGGPGARVLSGVDQLASWQRLAP
jgi:hypothetical protein